VDVRFDRVHRRAAIGMSGLDVSDNFPNPSVIVPFFDNFHGGCSAIRREEGRPSAMGSLELVAVTLHVPESWRMRSAVAERKKDRAIPVFLRFLLFMATPPIIRGLAIKTYCAQEERGMGREVTES
jgi:hypothetical protein